MMGNDLSWVNDLKPNAVVFISTRNTLERTTVHHITPTMIVVNRGNSTMRFNKKSCSYSAGSWDWYTLMDNTPENQKKYWRNELTSRLRSIVIGIDKKAAPSKMSDEQLVRWISLLDPLEKELDAMRKEVDKV